jgi:hypothetical protein
MPQAIARGLDLAQRTADTLDAEHQRHGTRVVLLARAGQDLTGTDSTSRTSAGPIARPKARGAWCTS